MTRWLAALVLAWSAPSYAGWHAVLRESRAGVKPATLDVWYDDGKLRLDRGATSFINDFSGERVVIHDHARKRYRTVQLEQLAAFRQEARVVIKTTGGFAPEVVDNVEHGPPVLASTGKTRKAGAYTCDVFALKSKLFEIEICAAKDVGIDWADFRDRAAALADRVSAKAALPMLVQFAPLGFPVQARLQTTVLGRTQRTTTELASLSAASLSADKFAPPDAYTAEEFELRSGAAPKTR